MTGYISCFGGEKYRLPVILDWDFSYGCGEPCDAFELCFAYDSAMLEPLRAATGFTAEFDGRRVFTGVVDEFELTADSSGAVAVLRGRGMAALLMDNEATAAEYYPASLGLILENHVYPWGISDVRTTELPNVQGFKVSNGESQWGVLQNFAWFGGGVRPRFDRSGTLLLTGETGDTLLLDREAAVSFQRYTERRYGVISEALVVNKSLGISSTVENAGFKARGGFCRRVVPVPKTTWYDAMRHTGEYQIARSCDESALCVIEMPQLFAAFPGDIVRINDSPLDIRGSFYVLRSRVCADGEGGFTGLTLERMEE